MGEKLVEDELIQRWALVGEEPAQVAGKRGATRLGFALLLKFYQQHGRFPRNLGELPDDAIVHVARQVGVMAGELESYDWDGRTVEYHRAQIRAFLGFRECTVDDAEKLTAFLAEGICQQERRADRVREELLQRCRAAGIEQPSAGRAGRIVSSALRQAESALIMKMVSRIEPDVAGRIAALVAGAEDDEHAAVEGKGDVREDQGRTGEHQSEHDSGGGGETGGHPLDWPPSGSVR